MGNNRAESSAKGISSVAEADRGRRHNFQFCSCDAGKNIKYLKKHDLLLRGTA
jgi:hypothetical protein